MKTKSHLTLTVAAIAFFGAVAAPALAATFNDDFSSGLRPSYWTVTQTTPALFSVDDTKGDVRLAKTGTSPGGFQNVAVNLNMAAVGGPITGNFSEQIDFRDAVVGPNQDQVELHVHFQDGSFFFLVYQTGPNVHVWIGSEHGTTAVSATSGTFTISRSGSTLTGSYNGSPIFSETNTSPVTAIEFTNQLQPGSNDNTSVTFDNFSLTANSVPGACTQRPSGMVSWWPGDGNANDIQGGNNGTLQNGVTFVPGEVGQAFHFNGESQFVRTSNAANLSFERTNTFSIDAWIRTSDKTHNIFIASKQQNSAPFPGYGIGIDNGQRPDCEPVNPASPGAGQLFAFLQNSDTGGCPPETLIQVRGATALNDGNWHHVAMTYNGSSTAAGVKLYVDGTQETTTVQFDTLGSNSILNSVPFTIGSRDSGGVPFNGDVDEVEVFNRALSAAEIKAIVGAGSFGKCRTCTPPPSNMVAWYPGDGNTNDIQGGNNGTLMNGATFAPGLVGQAFRSNGVNQFVQVPDAPNIRFGPTSPMTVDLWVYRTSANQVQHFIGKRASCNGDGNGTFQMAFAFGAVLNGTCGVGFGHPDGATVCSGTNLPLNTWTHLAGTFDGTTLRIYINGQLKGSLVGPLGAANTAPLLIGATSLACNSRQQGGETTGGLIDEVEIFNRALSQTEIQAIVNAGNAGKCKARPGGGGLPPPTPTPTPTPRPGPGGG